jgi:hypothetical protein
MLTFSAIHFEIKLYVIHSSIKAWMNVNLEQTHNIALVSQNVFLRKGVIIYNDMLLLAYSSFDTL